MSEEVDTWDSLACHLDRTASRSSGKSNNSLPVPKRQKPEICKSRSRIAANWIIDW